MFFFSLFLFLLHQHHKDSTYPFYTLLELFLYCYSLLWSTRDFQHYRSTARIISKTQCGVSSDVESTEKWVIISCLEFLSYAFGNSSLENWLTKSKKSGFKVQHHHHIRVPPAGPAMVPRPIGTRDWNGWWMVIVRRTLATLVVDFLLLICNSTTTHRCNFASMSISNCLVGWDCPFQRNPLPGSINFFIFKITYLEALCCNQTP